MTGIDSLQLTLSVRTLVEFSARAGDLFSDSPAGPTALAGLKGHQKIQAQRGPDWQAEHRVGTSLVLAGCEVTLGGRIDLFNPLHSPPMVEEIKTTFCQPQQLAAEKRALHWAQTRVYAYLAGLGLAEAGAPVTQLALRVSWYDLLSDTLSSEDRVASMLELAEFTRGLLQVYIDWYRQVLAQRKLQRRSAQDLQFPFADYRPQQQQLARFVYRCVREQQQLLLEAPTGSGKTMSVLFPALKALGADLLQQVLYLTAKGSCQQGAEAALQQLCAAGFQGTYLRLQARQKTCPCQQAETNCVDAEGRCLRTIGFYDRLPEARAKCLQAGFMDPAQLASIAAEFDLCPFALGLELLPWFSLIVCDYNYLFDPLIKLAHFEQNGSRRLLLVDEIHNLPARARGMYSASLSAAQAQRMGAQLRSREGLQLAAKLARKLSRALTALGRQTPAADAAPKTITRVLEELLLALQVLEPLAANTEPSAVDGEPSALDKEPSALDKEPSALDKEPSALDKEPSAVDKEPSAVDGEPSALDKEPSASARQQSLLDSTGAEDFSAELVDWKKQLYRYARIAELFSTEHRHLVEVIAKDKFKDTQSQLLCLDARLFLSAIAARARSFTGFSATLQPLDFYADQLGLEGEHKVQLESSFAPQNQLLLLADFIDTRWQQRAASVAPLVSLIAATAHNRAGNYLVFFPSYHYLQTVLAAFVEQYPATRVVVQGGGASEAARHEFVQAFLADSKPKVGFAVLGGIYAEAVDYVGESLCGVIIVSPGLPQPSEAQKLLQQYYQQRGLNGFEFAFQFPGFSRVQQAAGRVIRSPSDRGVVILVDPRYSEARYRRLFPTHWQPQVARSLAAIEQALAGFWTALQ